MINKCRRHVVAFATAIALVVAGTAISSSPTLAADQNIAPAQTISKSPGMYAGSVAVGPSGEVFTLNASPKRIDVFAPDANGLATPVRTITGASTQLDGAVQIAVDSVGRAYVTISTDPGKVLAFAAGASGDVAPVRVITAAGMKYPEGIAVDSQFNIYVGTDTSPDSSLMVFSPTANGPSVPIRNLTNGLSAVDTEYVAVDLDGNIFVPDNDATRRNVYVFAPDASDTSPPTRTIHTSGIPTAVTTDCSGRLFVNFTNNSIAVYSTSANGENPEPLEVISGSNTTLSGVGAMSWRCDGTAFVTNYGAPLHGNYLGFSTPYVAPVPTVTAASPTSGFTTAHKTMTIKGTAFMPNAIVTVGGKSCDSVHFVNTRTLTCVTSAKGSGTKVTVKTCGGTVSQSVSPGNTIVAGAVSGGSAHKKVNLHGATKKSSTTVYIYRARSSRSTARLVGTTTSHKHKWKKSKVPPGSDTSAYFCAVMGGARSNTIRVATGGRSATRAVGELRGDVVSCGKVG